MIFKQDADSSPNEFMVIGNQYSERLHLCPTRSGPSLFVALYDAETEQKVNGCGPKITDLAP
jgi:hypothetical protein